jgi:tetratricopeptide (TPR) repeat protein
MTSLPDLAVQFPPPPPPSNFVDRRSETRAIGRWIASDNPRPAVITGAAGIGKSALAAHLAARLQHEGWMTVWFRQGDFGQIGSPDVKSAAALRKAIEGYDSSALLVLDDEDDVEVIHLALEATRTTSCRLLITSRDPRLGELGLAINLRGLNYQDTLLLLRRIVPTLPVEECSLVAERVQGSPAGIQLAARAIRERGTNLGVADVLALLDEYSVHDEEAARLTRAGRAAIRGGRDDYRRGVDSLKQGDSKSALHYLIRASSTLDGVLGSHSADAMEANIALGEALKESGRLDESVSVMRYVLRRAQEARGHEDALTLRATLALAGVLRKFGALRDAIELNIVALETMERTLGSDHPDSLSAAASLAVLYWDTGQLDAALNLQQRVVVRSLEILGAGHPLTLATQSNLAAVLARRGEPAAAVKALHDVMVSSRTHLGETHPQTLSAAANLAYAYYAMGELRKAEGIERQVLEARISSLGLSHPETMQASYNLALTLDNCGKSVEANTLMSRVAEVHRRMGQDGAAPGYVVLALLFLAQKKVESQRWEDALVRVNEAIHAFNRLEEEERIPLSMVVSNMIAEVKSSLADADLSFLASKLASPNVVVQG